MPSIEKPCIRRCCLDENDICVGCFRAFDDMLKWNKSSREEKIEMLTKAKKREEAHLKKVASFHSKNSM